jgi:ABC-type multidrug transport system ATPase subunit
MDMIT